MVSSCSEDTFKPDPAHVSDCLAEMPPDDDTTQKFDIDTDRCANQPVDDYFVCGICQCIVQDPQQCGACDKLLCKDCIETWLSRKQTNSCVMCRQEFKAVRLNRFVLESLGKIKIACQKCNDDVAYTGWAQHMKAHSVIQTRCILKCGNQ